MKAFVIFVIVAALAVWVLHAGTKAREQARHRAAVAHCLADPNGFDCEDQP